MTVTRRWCLSCFEDFSEDTSSVGLCMACDYEHDRAVALGNLPFAVHNDRPLSEWWGPKLANINPEDIEFGFHEVTIGLSDEELEWQGI